jgi:heterodisulfide reductase subunit B
MFFSQVIYNSLSYQIPSERCFLNCNSVSSISFETESELTRIESKAFSSCSYLKSFTIPQNVGFIDGSAFVGISNISISVESSNLHFAIRSDFILDSSNRQLIRYFGNKSNIKIPRDVQILCSYCFASCYSLSSISFETESELTRIESYAFSSCFSLKSITIPRHVQILCSYCFVDCNSLSSILFETESELTRIESYAFSSCSSLKSITIPRHVQILCSSCFWSCELLSSISFETESELTRIESYAFSSCSSLKSITIPRHVQTLCSSCFPHCNLLSSISSETDSELRRIEAEAFGGTSLSLVVVPASTSFIAPDAFPAICVAIAARRTSRSGIQ